MKKKLNAVQKISTFSGRKKESTSSKNLLLCLPLIMDFILHEVFFNHNSSFYIIYTTTLTIFFYSILFLPVI